jgi:hypothetical protein
MRWEVESALCFCVWGFVEHGLELNSGAYIFGVVFFGLGLWSACQLTIKGGSTYAKLCGGATLVLFAVFICIYGFALASAPVTLADYVSGALCLMGGLWSAVWLINQPGV